MICLPDPFAGIPPELLEDVACRAIEYRQTLDVVEASDSSLQKTVEAAQRAARLTEELDVLLDR